MNLSFPSSCKYVALESFKGNCDLSNLNDFELETYSTTEENIKNILKTVSPSSTISSFRSRFNTVKFKDFSIFKEIYDENGNNKLKIKKIGPSDSGIGYDMVSLYGLEFIDGLESLTLVNCRNLSDISSLSNHDDTLTRLILSDASISKCGVFRELNKLTYVDLQNNSISDYYTDDVTGEPIYNIKAICEAVERGCQSASETSGKSVTGTVKLKGNDGVIDWGPYTSRTWASGSNYGRKDT